jgi:hypothetical protein
MSHQHDHEPLLQSRLSFIHSSARYGTSPRIDLEEEDLQEPDAGKAWMGSAIGNAFKKLAFGKNPSSVASLGDAAENSKKDGKTGPMRFVYYVIYALV